MQIKEGLKVMFGKSVDSISKAYPNLGAAIPLVFGNTFRWSLSGMSAYNNKIFYSAQNVLVNKLTEAPIMFSKRKKGGEQKLRKYYSKSISNEDRQRIKAQSLEEQENHPLNALFDSPNDYQSGIEMMEDFWFNYGYGDGFLYFESLGDESSRNQQPIAVHSLRRDRVQVVQSNLAFDGIAKYIYSGLNGVQIEIPKERILHFPHWNPNIGELKGLGVDQIASMDISLNNANNAMQGAAFKNGGRGTMFSSDIHVGTDGEVTEKMTAEQMSALKSTIRSDYAGIENYKKLHFTNGYVKAETFGDTMIETDAINAEDSQWKNIYTICGVPFVLSPAASSVSENSIIAGYKSLVTNTIVSILRKFDQKLTQRTFQWWPDIIACHDLTEFTELAPDLKLMREIYGQPTLDEDERRAIFGFDEMRDGLGKNYLIPTGLMKFQDVISDEFSDMTSADSETNPKSL